MKKMFQFLLLLIILLSPLTSYIPTTAAPLSQETSLFSEEILDQYIDLGQYEEAISYCSQIVSNINATAEEIHLASFGLGKIYFVRQDYSATVQFLLPLISNNIILPDHMDQIYYFLGESLYQIGNYAQAITYYQKYMEISDGTLDDILYEKIANAYRALGDPASAIQYYQSTIDAYNKEPFNFQIRIGQQYEALGNFTKAIEYYELVRDTTYNLDVVAQMNYYIGSAYQSLGDIPMAVGYYQTVITSYINSSFAYDALVKLIDLQQAVDYDTRGYIDFIAGQYSLSINAYGNYVNQTGDRRIDILYYLGMSHYYLEDIEMSMAFFQEIIQNFDYNTLTNENYYFYGLAYQQLALIYKSNLSDSQSAIDLYLEFAKRYPNDDFSPSFVYEAAEQYEISGDLAKAGEFYLSVAQGFQNSPNAFNSIIFSGISYYRLEDYKTAFNRFETASAYASSPEDHARAFFWKGKTQQALGNTSQAVTYYSQAENIDYYSYYGLRSEQILDGIEPFSIGMYDLDPNLSQYKQEAETWMIQTFNLPTNIELNDHSQLNVFPEYQRGILLNRLEEFTLAKLEFTSLLTKISNSPQYLYIFALDMIDQGYYYNAIYAIEYLLSLANATDFAITPTYFNYLQFGLYYWDLIYPTSNNFVLDPFFILSTIWQESLFDRIAGSSVGAQGLMQIMPLTGADINQKLGNYLPNFQTADLKRPNINIYFGSQYFSSARQNISPEPLVMLAAYNAGTSSAQYWLDAVGPEDMDVFVEVIGIDETRDYVRSIFTHYEVYRSLYEVK